MPFWPGVVNAATSAAVQGALMGVPVADNTFVAGQDTARTTTGTSRRPHTVAIASTDLRLVFTNWANSGATSTPNYNDKDSTGPITIKASVEIGGTIYRLTFGGNDTVTIAGGGWVQSDPLPIDMAAGTVFYSRTFLASGGTWHYNGYTGSTTGQGGWVTTTDLTAPGSAAVADVAFVPIYGPSAIIGKPLGGSGRSILVVGDSIGHGYGDAPGATAWQGRNINNAKLAGGGFIARALYTVVGFLNAAIPGDSAEWFVTIAGHFRRMTWASSATSVICQYGRNDISGGRTLAQIQADLLTIWTMAANRGAKAFQTTITPRTTSTDGWRSVGAQTKDANDAVRVALNGWLRAGAPIDPNTKAAVAVGTAGALLAGSQNHPLTGVFEIADLVEYRRDDGRFMAAVNQRTKADGVTTAGGSTVSSATAAFTSADVGRSIYVVGAGASGADLLTTITQVNSASSVNVALAATTAVSAASITVFDPYSVDGLHLSPYGAALASAGITPASLV